MLHEGHFYRDLHISFFVSGTRFDALSLSCERFMHALPSHSHSTHSYEIHYIAAGKGFITLDGLPYEVTPGTLYLTGPLMEHSQTPDSQNPMLEYCIYLKLADGYDRQHDSTLLTDFVGTRGWIGTDHQHTHDLFLQIFDEMQHRPTGYVELVSALLQQLLVKLVRSYQSTSFYSAIPAPSNLEQRSYLTIEECFLYEYPDLTLQKLANRLGLSIRQTERILQKQYGKNFQQMKNEAKMSAATIFLKDPTMRIADIADRLGYSSPEHFSSAFKQFFGTRATLYRKNDL